MIYLDSNIYGPWYWNFLYTIALIYPNNPNDTIIKKYYDLIINFPLFIPNQEHANNFSRFLDLYPVQPYLSCKESLVKWVWFIHNKINIFMGKPEMSYYNAMNNYYENYKLKDVKKIDERKNKHKFILATVIILLIILILLLYYNK